MNYIPTFWARVGRRGEAGLISKASYSDALMSSSEQIAIDINQDLLSIIEKDFKGLYSGELGNSSNETS